MTVSVAVWVTPPEEAVIVTCVEVLTALVVALVIWPLAATRNRALTRGARPPKRSFERRVLKPELGNEGGNSRHAAPLKRLRGGARLSPRSVH